MAVAKINGAKLKQAIEKFGSLEKAIENFENQKGILEKESTKLKKANEEVKLAKERLMADIDDLHGSRHGSRLQSVIVGRHRTKRKFPC